jgi:uncharacterized membrane protein YwzB
MDDLLLTLFELALFFILLVLNLQLFNSLNFEKMFKKGHIKQIQLMYFFTVIIFTYLLTSALMNLVELSIGLTA